VNRFLAFVWNASDSAANHQSKILVERVASRLRDLRTALISGGLASFQSGAGDQAFCAYPLPSDAGLIFGKLFTRNTETTTSGSVLQNSVSTPRSFDQIIQTRGRYLCDRYWGRYVAIIRSRTGDVDVFRDPGGSLPCFVARADRIWVIFSDLEDCIGAADLSISIDWNNILTALQCRRAITETTGIDGVIQVLPGQCFTITDKFAKTQFYWHPKAFCEPPIEEKPAVLAALLRQSIQSSVDCWASCFPRIVHQLSGGLDSSTVAACLAKANPQTAVTCFNLYTDSSEGDERRYARLAARSAGFDLIEHHHRISQMRLPQMLRNDRLPSPVMIDFHNGTVEALYALAESLDTRAVFSGQGGDHLFQRRRTTLIGAEYVRRHGFGSQFPKIAFETAQMTGKSMWRVLCDSTSYGLCNRPFYPFMDFTFPTMMNKEAIAGATRYNHPWVEDCESVPHAKIQQIADLIDTYNFHYMPRERVDFVHPMLAQPVIETCLRIPTYLLIYGGRERGLLRRAFSADVPSEIIGRTSKGGTSSFYHNLFERDLEFLREYLLSGMLAQQRFLDTAKLEDAFAPRQMTLGRHSLDFVTLVLAESWLRAIRSRSQRAAA